MSFWNKKAKNSVPATDVLAQANRTTNLYYAMVSQYADLAEVRLRVLREAVAYIEEQGWEENEGTLVSADALMDILDQADIIDRPTRTPLSLKD